MSILMVLSLLLAVIWRNSYAVFERGTVRMSVTQRGREVLRRITPFVMSALPRSELEEAILSPQTGQSGPILDFTTADDILEPMARINGRNPAHYRYRIALETDRSVRIRELELNGNPTGDEKTLAYRVEELQFDRLSVNVVKVKVVTIDKIRNAANQLEQLKVERSEVISLPFYSSTR